MEKLVVVLFVLFVAFLAFALGALVFSACLGVFAPAFGWPVLTWWQSFCFLWALGCVGGAMGVSRSIKAAK